MTGHHFPSPFCLYLSLFSHSAIKPNITVGTGIRMKIWGAWRWIQWGIVPLSVSLGDYYFPRALVKQQYYLVFLAIRGIYPPTLMPVTSSGAPALVLFKLNDNRRFLFLFLFLILFWPYCATCRILVPRPEIEPGPPAVEVWSPNHWTAREFPTEGLFAILWGSSGWANTCWPLNYPLIIRRILKLWQSVYSDR